MTVKQREKEEVKQNIIAAENTLVRTATLSMGRLTHDISHARSQLKYWLKRTCDIKTLKSPAFKAICSYRQQLESLYFQVHFLGGKV